MNKKSNRAFDLMNAINLLKRTGFAFSDNSKLRHSEKGFLWILATLDNGKPVTPSDIARKTNVTLAAITHHLNSLEEKGYIIRKEAKEDRRVSFICLSKKGKKLIDGSKSKHKSEMVKLVEYLGENDSKKLIELIEKITKYLEQKEIKSDD